MSNNKININRNSFLLIVIFFLILDICLTFFNLPLQVIIIISNIEIILLLFFSYKFLFYGFFIALFFNLLNSINLYLNYLVEDELILFQMALFRIVSIFISGIISYLANRQIKYVKRIEASSYLDALTEVFNHRFFQERLETEFSKAIRMNSILGIIFIDIDNFRGFNETYGHKNGDVLLKETAYMISNVVRSQDLVCRYGGDIFVVILPQLHKDEIKDIAEKIQKASKELLNTEYEISISIGYSTYPDIASTKDELISQADTALYHAKQQGRDNIKVYRDVFNDIKHNLSATESHLFTSLKTLLGTISAKDRYTLGHSERVMEYAIEIGKEIGLDEEDIKILRIAALLHDIGKIEIPQSVLNKKEKLTDEEFELIKKHPVYSAEIIKPLANLGKLHSIVLHHHERYDGKGYPSGIKGEGIPLEARILSVADSFDAMLSDRPYRKSLSMDKAIAELQRCANTQFDKNIVESFIKILHKNYLEKGES